MPRFEIFTLLVLAACFFPAVSLLATEEPGLDSFLERIRSADDDVRMKARKEAPGWGAAAVVPLAAVIEARKHADDQKPEEAARRREASISARHALTSIVHHAGRPGAAAERGPVARELVKLTRPTYSDYVRREALHYLGLIGGDEQVAVVAGNLRDDGRQIAEAARLALERLPGKAAEKALREAIGQADDRRKPDLIFSLAKKRSVDSVPLFLEQTRSRDDEVRFSAFQALAFAGSDAGIEPIMTAVSNSDEPLRQRLFTELLRLADIRLEQGDSTNWRRMHLYTLKNAPLAHHRERSLLKLSRRGNIAAADTLLIGLNDPSPRVRRRALWILESLQGVMVSEALRKGYEEASEEARPAILHALAKNDMKSAKEVLEKAAHSDNLELKIMALDLLDRLVDPSMESRYLDAARDASSAVRSIAYRGYLALARKKMEEGGKSEALEMFSEAMGVAREVEEKRAALTGIVALGDPRAIDRLQPLLVESALANEAATAYVSFARKLADGGEVDRAEKYLHEIISGKFPRDIIARAAEELRKMGRDPQAAVLRQGFVLGWWLIGPIADVDGKGMEKSFFPEERIRLNEVERIGPRRFRWQKLKDLCLEGRVDLVPLFRRSERVIAYAYTEIEMPEDTEVLLRIGSDDGVTCWLGGEKIHHSPGSRSYQLDQDVVPATLGKGKNKLLLKIGQGSGDWSFSLRLTDRQGRPVDLTAR